MQGGGKNARATILNSPSGGIGSSLLAPMSGTALPQIAWLLATLLVVSVQIVSSVMLLREKHIAPRLMLAGSVISLIGGLAGHILALFFVQRLEIDPMVAFNALNGLSYTGHLTFCIGLLLYALHQKGRADRIAELEAIIHSMHQRE
jgi:uncharacterized membrane protein YfcA